MMSANVVLFMDNIHGNNKDAQLKSHMSIEVAPIYCVLLGISTFILPMEKNN